MSLGFGVGDLLCLRRLRARGGASVQCSGTDGGSGVYILRAFAGQFQRSLRIVIASGEHQGCGGQKKTFRAHHVFIVAAAVHDAEVIGPMESGVSELQEIYRKNRVNFSLVCGDYRRHFEAKTGA
jgi:IS5 family transposase